VFVKNGAPVSFGRHMADVGMVMSDAPYWTFHSCLTYRIYASGRWLTWETEMTCIMSKTSTNYCSYFYRVHEKKRYMFIAALYT
jgi:hypothetical protein